ncbi:hypothetical protein HETIRDRAFT_424654 [Heterobasidion irregulare TC 32-1]|uniref:Uncharacterized protein n=1 Tax=Heterobasidion irregulare (strain TC 32-1) TaxID=747525 RepID=W4KJ37_HETIT|nr:uncharacterized protein HETIRDRAFT_424654 [Heterobasidion irregulare TC 32-1]ETW85320.1 hypothetical protein HETIRDRAFT_424654 [Heterobasidion irregulare TC 32-1]
MSQIPTTHRLVTRASNKDRHPGLLDAKVRRRSHADVTEERDLVEAAKESSKAKGKASVSKIALLEDHMQAVYTSDMANASNPGMSTMKKATRQIATVSASSTVISEGVLVIPKGQKAADTSNGSQDGPSNLPKKIRPTIRSEIMAECTVAEQSSKTNLKRKAMEGSEQEKSNSLASFDAQRLAPSGLNPGFSTRKVNPAFKIPVLPKAHLPSASISTPKQQAAPTHNKMDVDRNEDQAALDTDRGDSDNVILGADYGGLEDEDESREGAAIPRVMARQRNKGSLNKEKGHDFNTTNKTKVPSLLITHGHGFSMRAIQADNTNHNAVMPADLDKDGDTIKEFESLPCHMPASVKIQHHNLPEVDQFPLLSQPRNQSKSGRSNGFSIDDLPAGTQARWRRIFIPSWRDFVGTLENPWDVSSLIHELQQLWDAVFPSVPHTVAHTEVVLCNISMNGATGSQSPRFYHDLNDKSGDGAFWNGDQVFKDKGERAEYARWAIAHDRKIPFLWNFFDDTDPINVKSKGAFESPWGRQIKQLTLREEYHGNEKWSEQNVCRRDRGGRKPVRLSDVQQKERLNRKWGKKEVSRDGRVGPSRSACPISGEKDKEGGKERHGQNAIGSMWEYLVQRK